MRKLLLASFLALVSFCSPVFAQLPCGKGDVSLEEEQIVQQLIRQYQGLQKNKDGSSGPVYIAVKPHFIRTNEGTTTLTMTAVNNAVAICNQYFINAGIQFYICGTPANTPNYINNTEMYNWQTANFNRDAITNANNVDNAHNIYFSEHLGGVGGFSFGATQSKVNNRTFVLNGQADDDKTLAHELGHYFNLAHTFNKSASSTLTERELVTRNNAEVLPRLSANCVTSGDFICDTPADPYELTDGKLSNCSTTGAGITAVDANGDAFVPSAFNIMNYYFCRPYDFTAGQYARINAALAINNTPNPNSANRYTLDCAETEQTAPSNVNLVLISTAVSAGVTVHWTDNSSVETGYIIERSTLPSSGFVAIGGVDANVTSFVDSKVARGQQYYYRVKPSNSKATYNADIPSVVMPAVCGTAYSSGCLLNRNINNFQISTVSNTTLLVNNGSGCSANSYGDFTNLASATVTPGNTYKFSMNTGYTTGFFAQHVAIWVDANNNNDFTDAGERVFQSTGDVMNGTTLLSGQFTIPISATSGSVRLRIRSRSKSQGVVEDPCIEYSSGEAEDYLLYILPAITVTTPVTAVCAASNVFPVAFSTNISPEVGNQYTVQLSNKAGSFTAPITVGTGTGSPITVTIPAQTTAGGGYKLRVIASAPALTGAEMATFVFSGSIALSMSSLSACAGKPVTLSATASATGETFTYAFADANGLLAGAGNTRLIPGLLAGPYTFSVTATGTYGCQQQTSALVTVNANPTVSLTTGGSTTLTCSQASLTLTATGGDSYTFAGPGLSAENSSGTAVVTQLGTFTVTASNASGCISSTTIVITQDVSLPSVSITPSSATLTCTSPSLTLTAFTSETAILWSNGETTSTIPVSASGTYSVTVTASSGCTAVSSAVIVSDQIAPIAVLSSQPSTTLTCTNPSLTLTATGGSSYTLIGPGLDVQNLSGTAVVSQAGVFTALVAKANGCMDQTTTTIEIDQQVPVATLTSGLSTTLTCLQTSLTLTATGGSSYTFTGPGLATQNLSGTAIISQGGTFTVAVASANGCQSTTTISIHQITAPTAFSVTSDNLCTASSVTLVASGCPAAGSIHWPGGLTGPTFTTNIAGVYTATCVIGDCSSQFSGTVSAGLPVSIASFSATGTLTCSLTSVSLQASGVGLGYTITGPGQFSNTQTFGQDVLHQITAPAVTQAGVYTLVLSRGGYCTTSQTVSVSGNYLALPMTVTADGALGCGRTRALISAQGSLGTSYTLVGPETQINETGVFSVSTAGSYTVVTNLSTGPGCQAIGLVTVQSGGTPPSAWSLVASSPLSCDQPRVQLTATGYGDSFIFTGPSGYVFSNVFREVAIHDAISIEVTQPGTYKLVVYSGNCATNAYTVSVTGTPCR